MIFFQNGLFFIAGGSSLLTIIFNIGNIAPVIKVIGHFLEIN